MRIFEPEGTWNVDGANASSCLGTGHGSNAVNAEDRSTRPSERIIPIHKMILKDVKTYIEMHRRKVAHKFKTGKNDGFLFIGETTGQGISPDTITSEITALKVEAGIKWGFHGHSATYSMSIRPLIPR